jgi:hypothetical protein
MAIWRPVPQESRRDSQADMKDETQMVTEPPNFVATIRPALAHRPSSAASPLVSHVRRPQQDSKTARIQQQVRYCLESSSYAPLRSLRCRIADGALVIQGEVHSYYLKQVAQELVRRLKLVHPIVNEVTVTNDDTH